MSMRRSQHLKDVECLSLSINALAGPLARAHHLDKFRGIDTKIAEADVTRRVAYRPIARSRVYPAYALWFVVEILIYWIPVDNFRYLSHDGLRACPSFL